MNDTENYKNIKTDSSENQESDETKKPTKKSQAQLLQEALGLEPNDITDIEKKLFIARFIDYFSEDSFDFVYKERSITMYKNDMEKFLNSLEGGREEDKLLINSFNNKQIIEIIDKLKKKAEEQALEVAGVKQPIDKKIRKIMLISSVPIFILLILLSFLLMGGPYIWFLFTLVCVGCMVPQVVKAKTLKKWYTFKEENKSQFYTDNREDILILKDFTGEILNNIRNGLLDLKIPLQMIKFALHSRDYENLNLVSERKYRGTHQYFFQFEYPPGMEPFPIPEILLQQEQSELDESKRVKKPEKNFIILSELKAKDGVINSYMPLLKAELADKINSILNDCDFSVAPKKFNEIIPNYSQEMAIYCVCGQIIKIINTQICNYKNKFKFYLFEGEKCQGETDVFCGEKIYAISLMDESDDVPGELKEIFSS